MSRVVIALVVMIISFSLGIFAMFLFAGNRTEGNLVSYKKSVTATPSIYINKSVIPTQNITREVITNSDNSNINRDKKVDTFETEEISYTKSDIKYYLKRYFSELDSIVGKVVFDFRIYLNTNTYCAHDFSYYLEVDSLWSKISDLGYSVFQNIKYTNEQKKALKVQIKDQQYKIAQALIKKFPNKKISGHTSPELGVHYDWANFDELKEPDANKYENTKISSFRWTLILDK